MRGFLIQRRRSKHCRHSTGMQVFNRTGSSVQTVMHHMMHQLQAFGGIWSPPLTILSGMPTTENSVRA